MRKKTYQQNCSLALASDLLCERWTFLLFRELLIQPCRFKELNQFLSGIGTNLLATRLKELENDGLIKKVEPGNRHSAYQLTDKGREVEPTILAMIGWGYRHSQFDSQYLHYHHWDLLAMKAFFNPARCQQPAVLQLISPELTAWIKISPQELVFQLGERDDYDLIEKSTLKGLQERIANQPLTNQPQLAAFINCFDLPQQATL